MDTGTHWRLPGAVQEPDTPHRRITQLEAKVAQLEQAVDSHAVIDQAIGVVVAVGGMSPAEAWDVLRETSMCTNVKLRHVAQLVVGWGETGVLASDIRDELSARLMR
ncbi:ANTAR domain-containing protein [Streptomyces bullii]|uniref:ANTAR domain-containing protein n=1 Tax=Streptomyces bullii TaxID=349910 RepID=A0ABW0UJK0_9ACTN